MYFYGKEFDEKHEFEMEFCEDYIAKRKTIQKKLDFKYNVTTKRYSVLFGMYAPFTVKTAPKLMEIGYKCGFGDINTCGMGLVKIKKGSN
jgi:CRISPR/Cas system endoribonuclease Cas6 (RAMP superfamily)